MFALLPPHTDIPGENDSGYCKIHGIMWFGSFCIWLWTQSIIVVLCRFGMA